MRQVPHALLTRPPLASASLHPEGIRPTRLVRLACVKHAASVHPEPGSNSHVNIEISLWPDLIWHFLLFVWVVLFKGPSKDLTSFKQSLFRSRIFRLMVISLFSCQGTAAFQLLSERQLANNITLFSLCQQKLLHFLKFFLRCHKAPSLSSIAHDIMFYGALI